MLCVFLNNTAELVKIGEVHWCDRWPGYDEELGHLVDSWR